MAGISKARHAEIQHFAHEILKTADQEAAVQSLVERFGVTRQTARRHVAKAERRKRGEPAEAAGWGGKRDGSGSPVSVVIEAENGRCRVAKYSPKRRGYVPAVNWQELEDKAALSVQAQGGEVSAPGQYVCPIWLKKAAVWA